MAELDGNERKKLYSKLYNDPDTKAETAKYSFKEWEKSFLDDAGKRSKIGLLAVGKNWVSDYSEFRNKYASELNPPAAPAAKPAAPVAAPVAAAPIEQAAPIPSVEPMEGEEISEVEYEGQMLPEVTAYGNLPEYGTQEYEEIIKGDYPVGSDEYNLQMAVKNQLPRVELGAGGYTQDMAANLPETMEKAKQSSLSPVFKDYEMAQKMMKGEVPLVTQKDVREAQEGFGRATKEQQQAAIMGTPGYNLEKEKEWEKLSGLEKTGQKVMDFASGFNRALFKTPSSVVKTSSELGVGILNMLGGDMKSEDAILYNLADKYDKWLDTSETAKKWIGDPNRGGLVSDVGSGIGQIFTMYATGGTGGASKALLSQPTVLKAVGQKMFSKPSMVSFSQIFNSEYEAMKAKGESDQTAFKQALLNGFTASPLENLPLVNLAERLNKTIGVKLTKRIINSLQQGAEEATQESVQQVFSNLSNNSLVELEKNIVDWARGVQPSAEAGGVVGALIGGLANVRDARKYATSKVGLSTFSPAIQESQVVQIAANDYQKSISRAEEQGKKPDKFDVKQLEKLRNDPEAWVKGEIKYLTQKIEEDKKANIDTKVTEADLAEHNALLAQIKAEKKGMEQAALAPAQEAAPVAPEAEVVPAETVMAPEVTAPVAFPSDEQIADDIQNKRFARFTYSNESEVPEQFKDKISLRGETNGVPFVRVTLPQSVAEYEASRVAPEAPVTETAPVTEESPVAEETIPVAPETEEDYSFLEETELTPEERDALLAQEETAPVAPVQVLRPKLPEIQVPKPEGFAPFLRKLGYTDEEISKMTFEQQQEIATNKTEPARAEGSSKVDVAKENQRVEKVAEAQRKIDEEIAAEEAAPEAPAAPMKEVGVGGIIRGHEDIVGNEGLGDVRNQLSEENNGVIVANGKDGNQYAVAFSRKGGDRQNIWEQGSSTPRPGHIYTSVKIEDPSNAQEVEAAKKQAEAALAEILPTVKGGNIRASDVQQAITDFQTKKPAEPAPKKKAAPAAPAPKAETKQEAPKPEAKPSSTTPQEGATVEIPAQRAEFGTRNMVFKEGEWKQNVGGDMVKVGPAVQQQAQEAFAGKAEAKPAAETKTEAAQKEEGKKPSAKELASQIEDMRSLPPAKRKAAQQAIEERYGKEDVAKMIEITANFTKIIDDLEQRGVVKIDCP
jgi:hypothetical protein